MAGPMAGVVGHPQTQLKAEEPINAEHGADAPLLDPQKKAQSTRLHRPSHPLSQKIQKKTHVTSIKKAWQGLHEFLQSRIPGVCSDHMGVSIAMGVPQ